MIDFEAALERLKDHLRLREDQEVAALLGLTKSNFSARKKRGSFPERELVELSMKRPELDLDIAFVLTGQTASGRAVEGAAKVTALARKRMLEMGMQRDADSEDRACATAREPAAEFGVVRSDAERQLLSDLRRCSTTDQAALLHLVARLAELGR